MRCPITAHIAITQIVCQDIDDIGLRCLYGGRAVQSKNRQKRHNQAITECFHVIIEQESPGAFQDQLPTASPSQAEPPHCDGGTLAPKPVSRHLLDQPTVFAVKALPLRSLLALTKNVAIFTSCKFRMRRIPGDCRPAGLWLYRSN